MKKLLIFLFATTLSFAQTLDPTFGTGGITKAQVSNTPSFQRFYDAVLQNDGKMVYVGQIRTPLISAVIARYNTDGTKDNDFNQYGFKTVSSSNNYLQTVCVQNDGNIIAAGGNTILKFLSDGTADTSFNATGSINVVYNTYNMNIKSVSVQADNKIVVSGYIFIGTNSDFAVARINTDGSLDTSFDTDGIVLISMGSGNDQAFSHKIQPDGKILVFGDSNNGTDYDFALARINTDGTLDTGFGTNGKAITSMATGNDYGRSMDILADGTIVVFGSSTGKYAVAKYTNTGFLDTTFDSDGKLILNHNISVTTTTSGTTIHNIPKIKVLSSGKIVLGGTSDLDYKIVQLLINGTYDNTFDGDGVVTVNEEDDTFSFLAEKIDGKIITGGFTNTPSLVNYKIKQLELNTNGSVFSNTIKNLYLTYDKSYASAIQVIDDSIVISSVSFLNNQSSLILKKFLTDGTQDMSFGNLGYTELSYDGFTNKILITSDTNIFVSSGYYLYKINANGVLDNSFGTGGKLDLFPFTNSSSIIIDDLILSNDNKILIAYDDNGIDNRILKLKLDGTPDNSFGTNGVVNYRINTDTTNYFEYPTSIIQDNSNSIIITSLAYSHTGIYDNQSILVAKLNSDGTFDNTFGTMGKYEYLYGQNIYPYKIINSLDDNYLIGFSLYTEKNGQSYTLKLNNNGSVFTSYGLNGISNDLTKSSNNMVAMMLQADGKIIKGNYNNNHFSISRYNSDGSADNTFGSSGEISTPIGFESGIKDLLIQPDGKLVATGSSFDGDRQVITLARYTGLTLGTIDFTPTKNSILVYPNPIEQEATFEYTLNQDTTVTISVIDMLGRVIKNITTNEPQIAGKQILRLSMENTVSSGNYFIKISSPQGSQSVQIIKK